MALKNFVEPGFQCSLVCQRHWDPRQIEQAGAQTEVAGRPVDRAVASQRSSSQCADDNGRRITMHSINVVHAAPINTGAWSMSNTSEPDYTISIIERDDLSIVCEGGIEISEPMDRQKAKSWANQYQLWRQGRCCVCGSAITRPDDPWETYSVSSSLGAD